jgi:hypothetical protein
MNGIVKRAIEPSSWAGLAGLLEGLKFLLPAHVATVVALQAICGGVAVILREQGWPPVPASPASQANGQQSQPQTTQTGAAQAVAGDALDDRFRNIN